MKKSSMTLLEIMVVIFLIGLISGILGYNIKGGMDKGRAFRSKEGARIVQDILSLQVAEGENIEKIVESPEEYLQKSGLIAKPKEALRDGWGKDYIITFEDDEIHVTSAALEAYDKKHRPATKTEPENKDAAESE